MKADPYATAPGAQDEPDPDASLFSLLNER
jgi:hypothetical protein